MEVKRKTETAGALVVISKRGLAIILICRYIDRYWSLLFITFGGS